MTTLTATTSLDMTTGMAGISSELSLSQLMTSNDVGTHLFWSLNGGGGMSFDLTFTPPGEVDFEQAVIGSGGSVALNQIRLYSSGASETGLQWSASGVPFTLTLQAPSYSVDEVTGAGFINFSATISDFWHTTVHVTFSDYDNGDTWVFDPFNQSFLGGAAAYGNNFVPYIMRDADQVTGSSSNDTLLGYDGNDTVLGGGGADSLVGGNGFDSMLGGDGNDFLGGGLNADFLDGGNGDDLVSGGNGPDTLLGGDGNDNIIGGLGLDSLVGGNGFDTLSGGDMNDFLGGGLNADSLDGGNGDDTVSGGNGPDTLVGGAGNDQIIGGLGFDSLVGGEGNDTLDGGALNDMMTGGNGDDWFKLTATALNTGDLVAGAQDTITDMLATDRLDISNELAGLLMIGGVALNSDTFNDLLGSSFVMGSTNVAFSTSTNLFMIDLDGSGNFDANLDFSIKLLGLPGSAIYIADGSTSFTF